MASSVDICNLALAHLGDSATVASIDPPEGSAQAEHCARFYPIALGGLLESHPWGFATRTDALALLADTVGDWTYAYTRPADAARVLDIYGADLTTVQPFALGVLSGRPVVLTDAEDASARYIVRVTDPATFPHLFMLALSYALAALLAGPILKGKTGSEQAAAMLKLSLMYSEQAKVQDANEGPVTLDSRPDWITDR